MSNDGGLRPLFALHLPTEFHQQPIETGGTGRGIPDENYCCGGAEGWIEFKRSEGAKGLRFSLRPEQIGWMGRRSRAGGRVFVAVRRVVEASLIDQLWLLGPEHIRDKNLEALSAPYRGRWAGGPRNWNWEEVAALLVGALYNAS